MKNRMGLLLFDSQVQKRNFTFILIEFFSEALDFYLDSRLLYLGFQAFVF